MRFRLWALGFFANQAYKDKIYLFQPEVDRIKMVNGFVLYNALQWPGKAQGEARPAYGKYLRSGLLSWILLHMH
jgi:hypothetical protein